jgi:hypothetical protein
MYTGRGRSNAPISHCLYGSNSFSFASAEDMRKDAWSVCIYLASPRLIGWTGRLISLSFGYLMYESSCFMSVLHDVT